MPKLTTLSFSIVDGPLPFGRPHQSGPGPLGAAVFAGFLALALMSAPASAQPRVLKEMPAKGTVRKGEVIYVDDGQCPAGEVKRIVGGHQKSGESRQVECVKKPPSP